MSDEEINAIKILEDDAYNYTCITKKYCKINEVDGMTCAKCIQQSYDIVEKLIYKQEKVIDLMTTELSRRPLMIYLDNERDDRLVILDNPKEIIKYYTKKAEEEK